jgi:hypothetical protein
MRLDGLMVSFHVVSLFTRVPTMESMGLLKLHFGEDILALFRHPLASTYICIGGEFYEQTDGVAMGFSLSPVINNFFIEHFEQRALEQANHKPQCSFWYVDEAFVILPHRPEKLVGFLDHLNGLHWNIHFTMETEKNGHLLFLDIDTYRRLHGSLGHKVYHKPTHPNIYRNLGSHYHPSSKHGILANLVHIARALCD